MASLFTKILNKEIDGHVITENERFFAILDKFPTQPGHTLVIPKQEVDYVFSLDEETYHELWTFTRYVANALQEVTGAKKIGIKVEGLEIPHAHVHLIPINAPSDFTGNASVTEERQEQLRASIQNSLETES